ncbi:MAG: SDR family oxidoreductase [Clostridia bacterium]|nr:SDR family oxidoreductase [Clostridia bacterium]
MKTAIVTGGSRGIGRSVAVALSQKGYFVCVNYLRDRSGAGETLNEILETGGCGMTFRADVRNPHEIGEMFEAACANGALSVLVNNAGVSHIGLLQRMSDTEIRNVIDTDLLGTLFCSREAIPRLLQNHSGSIVNIASVWGVCGASCETVYSAAKAGVAGFTKALAKELGPSGINVNCVSPGVIDTEMNSGLDLGSLAEQTLAGRIGEPEEIARAVVFLTENSYITGQNIIIDGGFIS